MSRRNDYDLNRPCKYCGLPLEPRPGEPPSYFNRRLVCDRRESVLLLRRYWQVRGSYLQAVDPARRLGPRVALLSGTVPAAEAPAWCRRCGGLWSVETGALACRTCGARVHVREWIVAEAPLEHGPLDLLRSERRGRW